ncbi:MAG: N-acetylmuramoyl-L-alanine amidase [Gammaproteobacteria bacterium]|nr:N-acetylmuramoyl-L-alanine amidase [Gammaproteobacteria bacterium]
MINLEQIKLPTLNGAVRDKNHKIDLIVIHAMSSYFIKDRGPNHIHAPDFLNSIGLSCHYMIDPSGICIECADPAKLTTWHAKGFNTNSIGIELLLPGCVTYSDFKDIMEHYNWITSAQLNQLTRMCHALMVKFNMDGRPEKHIKTHCELDPTRKVDPGKHFNKGLLCSIIEQRILGNEEI